MITRPLVFDEIGWLHCEFKEADMILMRAKLRVTQDRVWIRVRNTEDIFSWTTPPCSFLITHQLRFGSVQHCATHLDSPLLFNTSATKQRSCFYFDFQSTQFEFPDYKHTHSGSKISFLPYWPIKTTWANLFPLLAIHMNIHMLICGCFNHNLFPNNWFNWIKHL